LREWQARGAVVRTAAGELALGLSSGRVHLEAVNIDPRQAAPAPRSQARCHSPLACRTRKRRQQLAQPSASRPKAPLASGGYIRRIPVTGAPRRLLGRSPIERSTPGTCVPVVDGSVRGIAATDHRPSPMCGVATVNGIGPRESSGSRCRRAQLLLGFRIAPAACPLARSPVLQYVHSN
jgi:hypothetical protein